MSGYITLLSLDEQLARAHEDKERAHADTQSARVELEAAKSRADELAQLVIECSEAMPALEGALRDARVTLEEARGAALSTRQAIELSATRSPATPITRVSGLTTAMGSSTAPILQVPQG